MPKKAGLPEFVKFRYDNHFVDEISVRTKTEIIRHIPMDKIVPNSMQPRKDMGDLRELSESIKEKGVIAPILVRPKDGRFEIIAGERRYRAAKLIGLKEVPCLEYKIPDNEVLELSIIENVQRKDLSIFEQAYSLKSLADIYGYTHQDIAEKISRSRVTVSELLRVTDLPADIAERCMQIGINSKTFLLELVKLKNKEEMIAVLDAYNQEPFSRDAIKEIRKKGEKPAAQPKPKHFKFNFSSDDKSVNIRFNIQRTDVSQLELINILQGLIDDIKKDKFKAFQKKTADKKKP